MSEPIDESIEFGGLVWRLNKKKLPEIEYRSEIPGVGSVRVYQYPQKDWLASSELEQLIPQGSLRGMYSVCSGIVSSITEAMQFCMESKQIALADLKAMFIALDGGDSYSMGFHAGQEELRNKIMQVLP